MKPLAFPKSARLLTPGDYGKVFDNVQVRVPHRNFLILATPNSLGHARVGLVFAKRNLKHAVQRNRIKRQVRDTFRLRTDIPALDIIVLGRQGLAQLDNREVRQLLEDLWGRLKRKSRAISANPDPSGNSGEGQA
jgi:ribonuclease P protein component